MQPWWAEETYQIHSNYYKLVYIRLPFWSCFRWHTWCGFWSWNLQIFFTEIKFSIPYLCEWLSVARIVLRESLLFLSLFLNPILTGSTQLLLTGLVAECMSDMKLCEHEQQSLYLHLTRHVQILFHIPPATDSFSHLQKGSVGMVFRLVTTDAFYIYILHGRWVFIFLTVH